MTDEEKKAVDLAAQAKAQADANVGEALDSAEELRSRAVAEADAADAETPTPTQAELDRAKAGGHVEAKAGAYKTRQAKAG